MDYSKIYNNLINRAKDRILENDVYTEVHHIVPRCMGGENDVSNLVKLTGPEHYTAHLLLVKIYPDNRLIVYAARMMSINSHVHKNGRSKNKLYAWLKERYVVASTGVSRSEKTKLKMSASAKGKPKSEEAKNNMRVPKRNYRSRKGVSTGIVTSGCFSKGNVPWNKGKSHMAGEDNPAYGNTWSAEKREGMSKTNKGRKRVHRDDGTFFYTYPHLNKGSANE